MRQSWALGLPHASEIPFFFRTIDAAGYVGPTTKADQAMAATMSGYFVNFAKTGRPNGSALPAWPIYDETARPVMDFSITGARGGADPWRPRLDLIEASFESAPSLDPYAADTV